MQYLPARSKDRRLLRFYANHILPATLNIISSYNKGQRISKDQSNDDFNSDRSSGISFRAHTQIRKL